MSVRSVATAAMFLEWAVLVLLMLRVSAFRVDRGRGRSFLGWPLLGPLSILPEKYNEEGRRLLRWVWALSVVLLANIALVLWLFARPG